MRGVVAILPGQELVEALDRAKDNPSFRRGLVARMIPPAYRTGHKIEWRVAKNGRLWLAIKRQD